MVNTQIEKRCPRPKCKGHLVLRWSQFTVEKYLICSEFPKCNYSESVDSKLEKEKDIND